MLRNIYQIQRRQRREKKLVRMIPNNKITSKLNNFVSQSINVVVIYNKSMQTAVICNKSIKEKYIDHDKAIGI